MPMLLQISQLCYVLSRKCKCFSLEWLNNDPEIFITPSSVKPLPLNNNLFINSFSLPHEVNISSPSQAMVIILDDKCK